MTGEARHYTEPVERVLSRVSDDEIRYGFADLFLSTQQDIDAQRADLVILAARRLVCVYQLLVNAGMPKLTGSLVVSDRYLESGKDQFTEPPRSVVVLDDSVVVGTTLHRLRQSLTRVAPNAHVKYRTVCVDTEQVAEFLFTDVDFEPFCARSSRDVERYSTELVLALFDGQVPLFTDFPTTRYVEMRRDDWTAFLEELPWHVADVSPPGLDGLNQWALTLIPHDDTQSEYLQRLEPAAAALVDAVKVRCYAREFDGFIRVVFVPLAMIAAAAPRVLIETLDSIAVALHALNQHSRLEWQGWDNEALHRLVQLYTSACILAELWPHIAKHCDQPTRLDAAFLERVPLDLYFGTSSDAVLAAFENVVLAYNHASAANRKLAIREFAEEPAPWRLLRDDAVQRVLWGTQATLEALGMPEQPMPGHMTKVGAVLGQSVSAVFGFINETYEIPQRRQIRELGSVEAYREWSGDGGRRILGQGVTLRQLVYSVFPDGQRSPALWDRSVVSLGIDQGNDLGIIVPVTRYDPKRDLVYRCFRIGETAVLTPRPLVEAVSSMVLDPFVAAMIKGLPLVGEICPIKEGLNHRQREEISASSLADYVLRRVPGLPVERYEGTVLEVTGEHVVARVVSSGTDELEFIHFPLARLPGKGNDVKPGTAFVMSAFEKATDTETSRELRFRLRRVPQIPTHVIDN